MAAEAVDCSVQTIEVPLKAVAAAVAAAAGQTAAAAVAAAPNVPTHWTMMTTHRMAEPEEPAVLSVPLVVPVVVVIALEPKDMESITVDMMPNPEAAVPVDTEYLQPPLQAAAQAEQKKIIPITQVTAAQAVLRLPRLHGILKATLYYQPPAN